MKTLLARAASLFGSAVLIAALPGLALSNHGGAPPSFDGFNGDCTACHTSFEVNTGTGGVTIDAPTTYVVGEPVQITVRVNNTTDPDPDGVGMRTGFEVGVRDGEGVPVGSFDLGGSTAIGLANNGADDWVTHTAAGIDQSEWTFSWVPPATGAPPTVTIYAAGNAANGNGTSSGDYIYTASRDLTLASTSEPTPEADGVRLGSVAPNPVRDRGRATLTLAQPAVVSARLVDVRGRTVRAFPEAAHPAGESALDVDVRGVAAGAYFLIVNVPEGRRTARVIVAG